jgi:hypothetical protein
MLLLEVLRGPQPLVRVCYDVQLCNTKLQHQDGMENISRSLHDGLLMGPGVDDGTSSRLPDCGVVLIQTSPIAPQTLRRQQRLLWQVQLLNLTSRYSVNLKKPARKIPGITLV